MRNDLIFNQDYLKKNKFNKYFTKFKKKKVLEKQHDKTNY